MESNYSVFHSSSNTSVPLRSPSSTSKHNPLVYCPYEDDGGNETEGQYSLSVQHPFDASLDPFSRVKASYSTDLDDEGSTSNRQTSSPKPTAPENLKGPRISQAVSNIEGYFDETAAPPESPTAGSDDDYDLSKIELMFGSIWNYKFQKFLAETQHSARAWTEVRLLKELAEDFASVAELFGRVIISEFDPKIFSMTGDEYEQCVARMTIKPNKSLGGIAGGVKYVHAGILFKFALDWTGMYAFNDEWAMKAANLELKGMRCMEWAAISGLHFPLFTVVHLHGYTLVAQCLVPIDRSTLCYGSVNAGNSFVCSDEAAHSMVLALGQKLNLRRVTIRATTGLLIEHAGPTDIEVHKGRDGRYYVIDAARLMPPEPSAKTRGVFSHCLRPTFVLRAENPLASDILTGFMKNFVGFNKKAECDAHRLACNRLEQCSLSDLLNLVNPSAFFEDDEIPFRKSAQMDKDKYLLCEQSTILFNIHSGGWNYRHCGAIVDSAFKQLTTKELPLLSEAKQRLKILIETLVIEGCARTLKNLVWKVLRDSKSASVYPSLNLLRSSAHTFLKPFFKGSVEESKRAWDQFHEAVQFRFPGMLNFIPMAKFPETLVRFGWRAFLSRFVAVSGVKLSSRLLTSKSNNLEIFMSDIVDFHSRTSMMSILEISSARSSAVSYQEMARSTAGKHDKPETELLLSEIAHEAVDKLRSHIRRAPLISEEATTLLSRFRAVLFNSTGFAFFGGHGVEQNYQTALSWFLRAAELNFARAQSNLGLMYYQGRGVEKNFDEAFRWFSRAAEKGNAEACNRLGVMFFNGQGTKQDLTLAAGWYRLSSEKGSAEGLFNLAEMVKDGIGIEKNSAHAYRLFEMASELAHPQATYSLGLMLENGHGCIQSLAEAAKHFKRASELGVAKAQLAYADMAYEGRGMERNLSEAFRWYLAAAREGNSPAAQFAIAELYRRGLGVPKDPGQSSEYYRKAAEQGHARAQFNLGKLYDEGNGVVQDFEEAARWFLKAAEHGYVEAQYNIAIMLVAGQGVQKDYPRAAYWFQTAAEGGHLGAREKLGIK